MEEKITIQQIGKIFIETPIEELLTSKLLKNAINEFEYHNPGHLITFKVDENTRKANLIWSI